MSTKQIKKPIIINKPLCWGYYNIWILMEVFHNQFHHLCIYFREQLALCIDRIAACPAVTVIIQAHRKTIRIAYVLPFIGKVLNAAPSRRPWVDLIGNAHIVIVIIVLDLRRKKAVRNTHCSVVIYCKIFRAALHCGAKLCARDLAHDQ